MSKTKIKPVLFLARVLAFIPIGIVKAYQIVISPFFPSSCRFVPTCSVYSIEAYKKYGILKGTWLTFRRLSRCHPWGGHGYDPVT